MARLSETMTTTKYHVTTSSSNQFDTNVIYLHVSWKVVAEPAIAIRKVQRDVCWAGYARSSTPATNMELPGEGVPFVLLHDALVFH